MKSIEWVWDGDECGGQWNLWIGQELVAWVSGCYASINGDGIRSYLIGEYKSQYEAKAAVVDYLISQYQFRVELLKKGEF